jgi:hypothetical protein
MARQAVGRLAEAVREKVARQLPLEFGDALRNVTLEEARVPDR